MYDQLRKVGELVGVLGHETGHVVARHSAEQIAKTQLTEGLTRADVIAACDPNNPNGCATSSQIAVIVNQLINLKYSRQDESEANWLGVFFIMESEYNPQEMIKVMKVLESLSQGSNPLEFLSTHPDPGNRIAQIESYLQHMDQCPKECKRIY